MKATILGFERETHPLAPSALEGEIHKAEGLSQSIKDSKILEINTKHKAEGFLMKLEGFVSLRSEIRLKRLSQQASATIPSISQKANANKAESLLFSLLALIALSGCTRIVKEPVYIPTKCEVIMPKLKSKTSDTLTNTKNILIYAEQLECALDFCIHSEPTLEHCKGER